MKRLLRRPLVPSPAIAFLLFAIGVGCRAQLTVPTAIESNQYSVPVACMPPDSLDVAYHGLAANSIVSFYKERQRRLYWTFDCEPVREADSLISFISNARSFGLLPANYHLTEIQTLYNELTSEQNIFRLEALLTDAYITLVQHIWRGQTVRTTHESDSVAVSLLLSSSVEGGLIDKVTTLENSLSGYRSLKLGLKLLIDSLPLEQREAVMSDSPEENDIVLSRIRTVEANLERWRLERSDFGERYILVNIPAFMLYVVDNDSVILESKIIVGTPENQTPQFSSIIECFVTYPYWHVPLKIAVGEYLPVIQKDTLFLKRNNFDVLDKKGNVLSPDSLDWSMFNENYFPVNLRQREGKENALGVIKFVFDNPYAVFVHDTNAKRLFRSSVRALSHGCIRMEKAEELAHYLVTGDVKKKSKNVERFLAEESRHTIQLKKPITIHIRYFTADFDGKNLRFYDDIYQKDTFIADQRDDQ